MNHDEGVAFCHHLVESISALRPVLAEHRSDNDGEVLSHLFMGDVSRWYLARYRGRDVGAVAELSKFLDIEFVSGSSYVRNLLAVSFIENLPWGQEDEALGVRSTLGPALQARQQEMWGWRQSTGSRRTD